MEPIRSKVLKNPRVKRMLLMVDNAQNESAKSDTLLNSAGTREEVNRGEHGQSYTHLDNSSTSEEVTGGHVTHMLQDECTKSDAISNTNNQCLTSGKPSSEQDLLKYNLRSEHGQSSYSSYSYTHLDNSSTSEGVTGGHVNHITHMLQDEVPKSDAISNTNNPTPGKPSFVQDLLKYNLRSLPGQKYLNCDNESADEDFSPDCSEYIPSPEKTVSISSNDSISGFSGNSQYINQVLQTGNSPSTVSNLSLYLGIANFVASPSVIYKVPRTENSTHVTDLVTKSSNQNNNVINSKSLLITELSKETSDNFTTDLNETLRPEQDLQNECSIVINEIDVTLTDGTENVCTNNDNFENENNFPRRTELIEVEDNLNEQQNLSTFEENNKLTRKRKQDKTQWRCKKNKNLKNSGEAYEGCNSKIKYPKKTVGATCTCKLDCGKKINSSDRQNIFDKFYSLADREQQWLYVGKHTKTENIKRMTLERKNNRTQTIKYYFKLNDEEVSVCKTFFLNTLQIGEQVVYTALEKLKSDEGLKDNRGTHNNRPRKMSAGTEASIKTHIGLFPKVESHYTRKTSKREYLSENLNISKMYRFYTVWFSEQNYDNVVMATKRQYETVFNTNYNYSFFKPKKDQCHSCSVYELADAAKKGSLEEKHKRHLERKEIIRQIKKEEIETGDKNNCTIAIFDLQKVLNIPQSEVSVFHYKRKYPVYNFTVFDALRKIGYCYVWHGQVAKRGSTEIGSCLLSFFKTEREKGVTSFSLYSDGCYGQNKNRYIFALYIYVSKLFGISITHRFFETGHSQNEGDSMHSCIERNLRNKVVYTPDQIFSIILNSKVTGEKYRVNQLQQSDFYDIKLLVDPISWRRDQDGNMIRWSNVMEVKVTHSEENRLYFKYNFEDSYSELNLQPATNTRRRGRPRTQGAAICPDNVELQQAYHRPIPITKALHSDLMSLCASGAIPEYYHTFYESLSYTDQIDNDIINEDVDMDENC